MVLQRSQWEKFGVPLDISLLETYEDQQVFCLLIKHQELLKHYEKSPILSILLASLFRMLLKEDDKQLRSQMEEQLITLFKTLQKKHGDSLSFIGEMRITRGKKETFDDPKNVTFFRLGQESIYILPAFFIQKFYSGKQEGTKQEKIDRLTGLCDTIGIFVQEEVEKASLFVETNAEPTAPVPNEEKPPTISSAEMTPYGASSAVFLPPPKQQQEPLDGDRPLLPAEQLLPAERMDGNPRVSGRLE